MKTEQMLAIIEQLRKENELLRKNPMNAIPIPSTEDFFCDGWNCDVKCECARFTLKPEEKAAYWARKQVDVDCLHFKVME